MHKPVHKGRQGIGTNLLRELAMGYKKADEVHEKRAREIIKLLIADPEKGAAEFDNAKGEVKDRVVLGLVFGGKASGPDGKAFGALAKKTKTAAAGIFAALNMTDCGADIMHDGY
ncbi:Uncharacterised protein [uncultured archaeon]|nr:Uncharacterised protein [uncultured archaeon]